MNLLELNFDIQGKIGQEISKIRKLEKIEQEQKQNKNEMLFQLNMIEKILRNNGHEITFVLEDTDLFDNEFCYEYLLEDEIYEQHYLQMNQYDED
tara:strand:+ start:670 stop:954 length:285 start_codon:yes stop_codon:yes gene_type:complete